MQVRASRPTLCHRVVSLDKKLYPTLSLSTQVYKMRTGNILLGVTLCGLASHPEGIAILSCHLLHATETVKLWLCGPPWLVCNLITYIVPTHFLITVKALISTRADYNSRHIPRELVCSPACKPTLSKNTNIILQ